MKTRRVVRRRQIATTPKLTIEKLESRRVLATFVVNTTIDDAGTDSCIQGTCSLRSAINAANATVARDTIHFAIPGDGVHDIRPAVALPPLRNPVVIDGTSQAGYNGAPRIVLDGSVVVDKPNSSESGLMLRGGNSELHGLSIISFPDYGIWIDGPGNTLITANYVGIRPDSEVPFGNGRGDGSAITVRDGIGIINSPNNRIGGPGVERNVVSGNVGAGILVWGATSQQNAIENNFIGLNAQGNSDIGNSRGIFIRNMASRNLVKDNVVSGNVVEGIRIVDPGVSENHIVSNKVGTSPDGQTAIPNKANGIRIGNGATSNIIGGPDADDGNLISGNARSGVLLAGTGTDRNKLLNNTIGLDANGDLLPNQFHGVQLFDGPQGNEIGGGDAGNTISGNLYDGVMIEGEGTSGNLFFGNFIGTDKRGIEQRSNNRNGITLTNGTHSNTIGGVQPNEGNTVAYNLLGAIRLDSRPNEATQLPGNQNSIRGNSIFLNATHAIDLGIHGLDVNDPLDADTGPNELQNRPDLLSAIASATATQITGSLSSKANSEYDLDFYFSQAPSGIGDAQFYLGSLRISTADDGYKEFSVDFSRFAPLGSTITATATDVSGNTSELSPPIFVESNDGKPRATIMDRATLEGDAGITNIEFEVRLSLPATKVISLPFSVIHGTTTESDFVTTSGIVTFPIGSTVSFASVGIAADILDEVDETFTVRLSPNPDVHIFRGDAKGTIFDDDSSHSRPFGASSRDLATYMLGKVKVAVILLDSDGTIDKEVERWTPSHKTL